MQRTKKESYTVHTPNQSKFPTSSQATGYLRFKVLEGADQGMKLTIPIYEHEYEDSVEMYQTLQQLSGGELVEAVLERESESDSWKPIELEIIDSDFASQF